MSIAEPGEAQEVRQLEQLLSTAHGGKMQRRQLLAEHHRAVFCPYYQRQVQMTAFRTRVCTHASLMRPLSVDKGISCNRFCKAKEPGVLFLDEANELEAAAMLSLTAA